jgi:hypothetical protein
LKSQKLYKIDRANVVFEIFDTEIVIINLENGNYYSYDGIGVDIWGLLKDQISINEVKKWIVNKYNQEDPSEIKEMISTSIAELENENLLIISERNNNIDNQINRKDIGVDINLDEKNFKNPVLQRYTDMQDFLLVDPIHEIEYEKWPKKNNKN